MGSGQRETVVVTPGNRNTIYLFVPICHLLGRIISKFLTLLSCGLGFLWGFIFVVLVL